ncbi:MAG TPA: lactonase family protein [Rhizomicrobium sp.]|jgi:6-phosphogluconolactonase|nr:lactonase family protein [Rhizomicrobium sp.]
MKNALFSLSAVIGALALLVLAPASHAASAAKSYFLYVGSYTRVTGKGIYGYRYTPATGEFVSQGLIQQAINPTWISETPDHRFLYSANDGPKSDGPGGGFNITAYARDATTGALTVLNTVPSGGYGPVQMAVAETGKVLVVANFGSAGVPPTVVSFPILSDGKLGDPRSNLAEAGVADGPPVQRDANGLSPTDTHVHCIMRSPDSRFVLACNLGLSRVYVYRVNPVSGLMVLNGEPFKVPGQSGGGSRPHHLTFSADGRFVYILDGDMGIVTAAYDAAHGTLKAIQTLPVIAPNPPGSTMSGSEIIADRTGRYVYVSARAVDKTLKSTRQNGTINVFAVNPTTGKLRPVQQVSSGGIAPRTIILDPTGTRLLVANQLSGAVTVLSVDRNTGKLSPTDKDLKDVPEPSDFLFEAER